MKKYNQLIEKICTQEYNNFIDYDNIIGVANGKKIVNGNQTQDQCLTIFVNKKLPISKLDPKKIISSAYKGIKTDVVEIGEIKALALNERMRPAMGGYSVGVVGITAGTIGCTAYSGSGTDINYYILSNNHVLAAENQAPLGSPIVQPGPYDGGTDPKDTIGSLEDFEPIKFITPNRYPVNYVDCAIAKCPFENISPEIYVQGYINGITLPALGMPVKKTGRTTAFTTGNILYTNATVLVNYNSGTALFQNQIITTSMSSGGDSGSLLLDYNNNAVGLLFAGSSFFTIYNPINTVLNILNITLSNLASEPH